jgi:diguanylate cyclase (GGDEF)-like protein
LCVRYAGDEFIVVLTDCTREMADAKRRELQAKVSEIQLEVRTGKQLHLAISAGASVFPHDGATYEALLADADQRMYRDKASRRGHVAPPQHVPPAEFVPTGVLDSSSLLGDDTQLGAA